MVGRIIKSKDHPCRYKREHRVEIMCPKGNLGNRKLD